MKSTTIEEQRTGTANQGIRRSVNIIDVQPSRLKESITEQVKQSYTMIVEHAAYLIDITKNNTGMKQHTRVKGKH
ncbi:hypothetical protein HUJ05_002685 [Dendroctonus ponderosae]|nr:hypothetical protein HUJ05_002685 [Dendroctonus ponderosae]